MQEIRSRRGADNNRSLKVIHRNLKETGASPQRLRAAATPFLKWAGGKSQLLKTFERYFPAKYNRYFEPFLGGGAVFFYLAQRHPKLQAHLSDCNRELINCYQSVRDDADMLIELLGKHRNDKHYFYKVRAQNTKELSRVERAARMIYLNKTCFNGLYRVNSKGQFNVPFGRYKNPKIVDAGNLRAVSDVLSKVDLTCQPFDKIVDRALSGDFVYLDPPYQPISATSNFTGYTKGAFNLDDQVRLSEVFRRLSARGCHLMLSNSDSPAIRELYQGFRIETVSATRAINSNALRRGRINELLILNYDPPSKDAKARS